jgi:hypothetical protein
MESNRVAEYHHKAELVERFLDMVQTYTATPSLTTHLQMPRNAVSSQRSLSTQRLAIVNYIFLSISIAGVGEGSTFLVTAI